MKAKFEFKVTVHCSLWVKRIQLWPFKSWFLGWKVAIMFTWIFSHVYCHSTVIYNGVMNYISKCMPLRVAVHMPLGATMSSGRVARGEGYALANFVATNASSSCPSDRCYRGIKWHMPLSTKRQVAPFPVYTMCQEHNQTCQEGAGYQGFDLVQPFQLNAL